MTELIDGERLVTLTSPKGHSIIGTLEKVHGAGTLTDIVEAEDGSLRFEYGGETKFFWDEQETVKTPAGDRVFICENGDMWAESKLVRQDA